MKNRIILVLVLAFFLFSCEVEKKEFKDALYIQNVSIIDAKNGLQHNMTVIVQDDRITKVTEATSLEISAKDNIIDGRGKFLIPGLWDAHVHFAYMEDLASSMFDLFLRYGITSVRDTGGKIDFVKEWKERALQNPATAPRVMIAGPLLDGMPNVYDGSDASHPPLSVGNSTIEEIVQTIGELDAEGVDLLKAYEMLTPEQFLALLEEAKKMGLKVTGHVPLSMDVITASNAGLNSMEHLRNLEMSMAKNADDLLTMRRKMLEEGQTDPGGVLRSRIHQAQRTLAIKNRDESKIQEVLAVLAKNQTWQIPTLALIRGRIEQHFGKEEWRKSLTYLPETIQKSWADRAEVLLPTEIEDLDKVFPEWALDMVGRINHADIGIMAGTDCPIFFLTPGLSLHWELEMLVKAGLTPMEALESATLNPAKYFGIQDELGLIAEGMMADLLLLEESPLEDIRNTLKIAMVIKAGQVYDRNNE